MNDALATLSHGLAEAVDRAAGSIVQVHGHRRPATAVVFGADLILAPAQALDDDEVTVRLPQGDTRPGVVLGRAWSLGLAAVRVDKLGLPPLETAPEPRVGHLALAVGRTWSGGVMATLTSIAVVGGPLRTGRSTQLERVIRIAQSPHGALVGGALVDGTGRALGVVTASDIRRTTVVIPAAIAWAIAQHLVSHGGTRQGYIGISTFPIDLSARQRGARTEARGLLITAIAEGSPADSAGLLVGDIILAFEGQSIEEPEALLTLLRGDRVGTDVTITTLRGSDVREVRATVGERPTRSRQGG